jgi:23S rRNA pseudouridine2605 synthase
MRLQRYLARAGVASRRHSEELIAAGRVSVNGTVVTALGTSVVPGKDHVEFDGEVVGLPVHSVYVVLNKPSGYVTTMSDPQGRPAVAELLPDVAGLVPVGRLDRDTTGVLLATTDGDLVNRLLHPSHHVEKAYRVVVEGAMGDSAIDRLRSGIELDDGPTRPAGAELLEREPASSTLTLTLREGRKRQVKRMCAALGHPVLELHRIAFGPITDDGLEPGETRILSDDEIEALRTAAGVEG